MLKVFEIDVYEVYEADAFDNLRELAGVYRNKQVARLALKEIERGIIIRTTYECYEGGEIERSKGVEIN